MIKLLGFERKLQILDITVTILIFTVGCILGKLVMVHTADTWFAFNGPVLGILGVGELLWWNARNRLRRYSSYTSFVR